MSPPRKMRPDEEIIAEAEQGGHTLQADIARALRVKPASLNHHLYAHPDVRDKVHAALERNRAAASDAEQRRRIEQAAPDDEITVGKEVTGAVSEHLDPDSPEARDLITELAEERGIDLDKWVCVDLQVRSYPVVPETGVVVDAKYVAAKFKPVTGMVVIRVAPKPKPRTVKPLKPRKGAPELVVLAGCYQIPFHDERAHELMLGFLGMVQPHRVGILGDFLDYPDVSRYQTNPAYRASVGDSNVIGAQMLEEIVDAAPGARVDMCKGNHEQRLEDWILKHAAAVHDVQRPAASVPWWHPRELLNLDALGITHHDPIGGQWTRARIQYSDVFAAMHGWRTKKAQAARDTAAELGMHVAQVHTHRQAITPVTIGRDGYEYMVQAVECGCMCRIDEGLGHTNGIADWQVGFVLASVWPDGVPTFELVQVIDGALRFRGRTHSPRQLKVAA